MPGLQRCTQADSIDGLSRRQLRCTETAVQEITMVSIDGFIMIIMGISVENQ